MKTVKASAMRCILLAGCVIALPFLLRQVAHGQSATTNATEKQHPLDSALDRCLDKNQATMGMVQCFDENEKAWDKEMNVQYRKLRSSLNTREQAKLVASQKAWLRYRDLETETQATVYGRMDGSMYHPMAADSHREIIRQRAQLLARYTELNDAK